MTAKLGCVSEKLKILLVFHSTCTNFVPEMEAAVTNKKTRLEWLDALRGFTMVMVVAYHVAQTGFGETLKNSSSMPFLIMFRMPLFFFVSGFLAYKASQVWNARNLGKLLAKKLRVQIVPTVIFFLVATAILHNNLDKTIMIHLHSMYKGGYWFTLVLLYMFVVYYLFAYVESKMKRRSWIPIVVLFVLSLVAYETCFLPKQFFYAYGHKGMADTIMTQTSFILLFQYFPFFLYGNIVHRYWKQAECVMDSRWFFPIVVLVALLSSLDALKWHTLRMEWANLPMTLARFTMLTIVFMFFRRYKESFTREHWVGRGLQYIGVRTLDIYLIHYIFLPHVSGVGAFFKVNPGNFVLDTTMSILLGLLVIGFCLVTSSILRISPLLKKYLFGRE